ncbi:hypothetical protein J6590_013529 [Homalodisca vitripennis]|nr:hypothetical protein J6590_013529 [Homalodisca vitripennis]
MAVIKKSVENGRARTKLPRSWRVRWKVRTLRDRDRDRDSEAKQLIMRIFACISAGSADCLTGETSL